MNDETPTMDFVKIVLALTVLILCIVMFFSLPMHAQHAVTLSCTPSTTPGVTYNVYRAPNQNASPSLSTCPAAVVPAATPWTQIKTGLTSCGGVDSTVTAGQALCYFMTAYLATATATTNAGESTPTNVVFALVPKDNPSPPTNLTITQLSLNTIGNSSLVMAAWTAPIDTPVRWRLVDDKNNLLADGVGISDGNMSWAGHREKAVIFTLCDATVCTSQAATL